MNAARQLSVVLPAAFAGPQLVAYLRDTSTHDALVELTALVDPAKFADAFGAPVEV